MMATTPTTHADRIARSLKRLGFRMSRAGRSFTVTDIGANGEGCGQAAAIILRRACNS
jgi:hypothetical protein